jgi:hypothetical protein
MSSDGRFIHRIVAASCSDRHELLFAAAAWSFYAADLRIIALVFAGIVVVHYGLSYDRIAWLLGK